MALRIGLTFDTTQPVAATSFARLFCDIQHLSFLLVVAGDPPRPMTLLDYEPLDDGLVRDETFWKYSNIVKMQPHVFGIAEVQVVRLRLESPLFIEFLLKIPKELYAPIAETFRTAWDRLFYPDLARRKKEVAIMRDEEELRQLRIESFAKAIDLERRIGDPQLREMYLKSLRKSIRPFDVEHPPVIELRTEVDEDHLL